MIEVIAVIGLALMCGAWVFVQERAEKEGCGGGSGCGACGGGKCEKSRGADSKAS